MPSQPSERSLPAAPGPAQELPLRFVVLHHSAVDPPHYDLMLETEPGSDLATWRFEHWPIDQPAAIVRLRNHRRLYLDYEGPIAGDRGAVSQLASGRCTIAVQPDGALHVTFDAASPTNHLQLRCISGDRWTASLLTAKPQ